MTNKYLEKLAGTMGETLRGAISPPWMEKYIAKQHGKEKAYDNYGQVYGSQAGGVARQTTKAGVGGSLGFIAGGTLSRIVGAPRMGPLLAVTGGALGAAGGYLSSVRNQAKEFHKKHS